MKNRDKLRQESLTGAPPAIWMSHPPASSRHQAGATPAPRHVTAVFVKIHDGARGASQTPWRFASDLDFAMRRAGLGDETPVRLSPGEGAAWVICRDCRSALRLASHLHARSGEHGLETRGASSADRPAYSVAIASGEVQEADGDICGLPIATARVLAARCRPGLTLIDVVTWDKLPAPAPSPPFWEERPFPMVVSLLRSITQGSYRGPMLVQAGRGSVLAFSRREGPTGRRVRRCRSRSPGKHELAAGLWCCPSPT
jgi:hypothetical protein